MTVRITTLDNGLRIITDDLPGIASATLGTWVAVGARHEPPELNGISHFLEHMAFKGTTTRTAQQIVEAIEDVGGHLNAYTSRENTAYHARVLQEHIPLAVDLIADILQHSTFEECEIERERNVILQELGQALDTPDDIIFDYFQETAFPNQPLGRPVLGRPEIIRGISQKDLKGYMDHHYTASRMVFAAAGSVDHDQIVELCLKHFTALPQHSPQPYEKATYKGGYFAETKDLEQVHLLIGFKSCAYGDADYFPFAVFSSLLGGGMSSRLFQEIREKRGLVYSISSFNSVFRDGGVFGIYAGTSENHVHELIPALQGVLRTFKETLEEKELMRSRAQFKAELLMSLERTSVRCEQLAQHMLIYGRPISYEEIIEKVNAVTREDVIRVAHALETGPITLTSLGPSGGITW